jgi:hypothetical protein
MRSSSSVASELRSLCSIFISGPGVGVLVMAGEVNLDVFGWVVAGYLDMRLVNGDSVRFKLHVLCEVAQVMS